MSKDLKVPLISDEAKRIFLNKYPEYNFNFFSVVYNIYHRYSERIFEIDIFEIEFENLKNNYPSLLNRKYEEEFRIREKSDFVRYLYISKDVLLDQS